jgi:hypothetical protein
MIKLPWWVPAWLFLNPEGCADDWMLAGRTLDETTLLTIASHDHHRPVLQIGQLFPRLGCRHYCFMDKVLELEAEIVALALPVVSVLDCRLSMVPPGADSPAIAQAR